MKSQVFLQIWTFLTMIYLILSQLPTKTSGSFDRIEEDFRAGV